MITFIRGLGDTSKKKTLHVRSHGTDNIRRQILANPMKRMDNLSFAHSNILSSNEGVSRNIQGIRFEGDDKLSMDALA